MRGLADTAGQGARTHTGSRHHSGLCCRAAAQLVQSQARPAQSADGHQAALSLSSWWSWAAHTQHPLRPVLPQQLAAATAAATQACAVAGTPARVALSSQSSLATFSSYAWLPGLDSLVWPMKLSGPSILHTCTCIPQQQQESAPHVLSANNQTVRASATALPMAATQHVLAVALSTAVLAGLS